MQESVYKSLLDMSQFKYNSDYFCEFLESQCGYYFGRAGLNLRIENFHTYRKIFESKSSDTLFCQNIAEYCPKYLSGHGKEERIHIQRELVDVIKSNESLIATKSQKENLNKYFAKETKEIDFQKLPEPFETLDINIR